MKPRTPDFHFFSRYWCNDHGLYRRHRYHWFTRVCRTDLFHILDHRPAGFCVEIGPGRGSTSPEESNPSDLYLDIIPWLLDRDSGIIADAQRLPFRDKSLAALWGQTVCMHLSWCHVLDECFRCIKKQGIIAFIEPLQKNPIIRCFRTFDSSRSSKPQYLSHESIRDLGERFGPPSVVPYFLFSPVIVPFTRKHRSLVTWLQSVDAYLLERYTPLREYAWYASIYWKT